MRKETSKKKEDKRKNKVILFLILIILMCVGIIIYLIFGYKGRVKDYPKGKNDKNIVKSEDDKDKMPKSNGGGSVSLSYSKNVKVNLKTKKVELNFKNPTKSTQSLVLEISIENNGENKVLVKTDRIPSGYAIYEIDLNEDIKLNKGKYKGNFNISYYDEDTEEKAIVTTNIPIDITVE